MLVQPVYYAYHWGLPYLLYLCWYNLFIMHTTGVCHICCTYVGTTCLLCIPLGSAISAVPMLVQRVYYAYHRGLPYLLYLCWYNLFIMHTTEVCHICCTYVGTTCLLCIPPRSAISAVPMLVQPVYYAYHRGLPYLLYLCWYNLFIMHT